MYRIVLFKYTVSDVKAKKIMSCNNFDESLLHVLNIYLHYCTHPHQKSLKKALKKSIKFNSIFKDSPHENFVKRALKYPIKMLYIKSH